MKEFGQPCEKLSDVSWLQEKLRKTRAGLVAELEKNSAVFGCYIWCWTGKASSSI